MRNKLLNTLIYLAVSLFTGTGCSKLLDIDPPIDSITTEEIFATNKQAEWAVAAIYTKMINGQNQEEFVLPFVAQTNFSAGLSTLQGAFSADELINNTDLSNSDYFSQRNKLTISNSDKTAELWFSAYQTIFDCNAVIDGIAGSTSKSLIDSVRKQLTGEALALRAFAFFYLVNFFGDVPLTLSSDFKKTQTLSRSPVSKVYGQIKADLIAARSMLGTDFSVGKNERVRVNKWFAESLLARVYLYTGEYQEAINSATAVIGHTALFSLEQDLNNSFTPNSKEAIFQLMPSDFFLNENTTPEGYRFQAIANSDTGPQLAYQLNEQLVAAFEPNDKRKTIWTKTMGPSIIANKYNNRERRQYYTVMRLAELYLIRAEATLLHSPAAKNNAIDDLNKLRGRAGVEELDYQLNASRVTDAIAHERRVELFVEWGHRWFDLKRTGKAHDVLSAIAYKQPWIGDYQLVYPIPDAEIKLNGHLQQNPEYNFR